MAQKRKITKVDRKIWRRNALKGTKKWADYTEATRKRKIRREKKTDWGFTGKSPRTKNIN